MIDDLCICNIGWGCGDNGISVCGGACSVHPPNGKCPDCGKKTHNDMRCWRCQDRLDNPGIL